MSAPTPGFYVLCLKEAPGGRLLWWKPKNNGYTTALDGAGIYTDADVAGEERYYHGGYHTVAIPVAAVRACLGADGKVLERHHAKLRVQRRPHACDAHRAVSLWNDAYPPGTPVRMKGHVRKFACTTTLAFESGEPLVGLRMDGVPSTVAVALVMPVDATWRRRAARVLFQGHPVGTLEELTRAGATRFIYDLAAPARRPLAPKMPLRAEPYGSHSLHPLFAYLLHEEHRLELRGTERALVRPDSFGALLVLGAMEKASIQVLREEAP